MFTEERQGKIEQCILERGSASVTELSNLFEVSEVTIRKDLDEVQKNGLIMRTHGGAVVKYQSFQRELFQNLAQKCQEEKKLIAKCAIELLEDGDTILLDGSSTISELAALINASGLKRLTVITTSLIIAQILNRDDIEVILLGGELDQRMKTVSGSITTSQIDAMSVDKGFIGINGIDAEFGFSATGFHEAAIKISICKASMQSYVLADHTKLNKRYLARVSKLGEGVDYIITGKKHRGINYEEIEQQVEVLYSE